MFSVLFSCFKMFQKKLKKMDNGVGGCSLTNPSFSRIFEIILTWQTPLASNYFK